jgi:hypothetical protein
MTAYTGISKHARWREAGEPPPEDSHLPEPRNVRIKECTVCGYKTIRMGLTWHCGEKMQNRWAKPSERIVLKPWPRPGR